jgi:hypothetical protein
MALFIDFKLQKYKLFLLSAIFSLSIGDASGRHVISSRQASVSMAAVFFFLFA